MTVISGFTSAGVRVPVQVTADGTLVVSGGTGGGTSAPVAVTLLNAVTTAQAGTIAVGSAKTLILEMYGTSTYSLVNFKAVSESATPLPLMGVRIADLEVGTSGTRGEIWSFDVTGLVSFTADLVSINGGNLTIKGKLVS
ncbi:hypothetical protein D3C71_234830 [compost metagenome]